MIRSAGREAPRTAWSPDVDLGSEAGVRQAYETYGPELYRFALRQLRHEAAAQDVVQETFLRAWRRADRYDPEVASLRGWLFAIARNILIDHVRKARVRPGDGTVLNPEDLLDAVGDDGRFSDAVLDRWLVEEALLRLSPGHRGALVETYLRGRRYAEVSAEAGVPVTTIRTRVFYGLKALRLALDEMGVEP